MKRGELFKPQNLSDLFISTITSDPFNLFADDAASKSSERDVLIHYPLRNFDWKERENMVSHLRLFNG